MVNFNKCGIPVYSCVLIASLAYTCEFLNLFKFVIDVVHDGDMENNGRKISRCK
jgi:hypothetical protein